MRENDFSIRLFNFFQMGVYLGRRRKGIFLAKRKPYLHSKHRLRADCKTKLVRAKLSIRSSTPVKVKRQIKDIGSASKYSPDLKRLRFLSPISQKDESVSGTNLTKTRRTLFDKHGTIDRNNVSAIDLEYPELPSDIEEETYLYSDESFVDTDINNCLNESFQTETNPPDQDDIKELLESVLPVLEEQGVKNEILTFFQLVKERKFPLNNVAFTLFIDVVKWFNSDDTRCMRYSDTSMKIFWLGKRLFGGKFLRFMSGMKNETSVLLGKTKLLPSESKINFACPNENTLST